MAPSEQLEGTHHCARCGSPPRDADRLACAECGRPLGICANASCGWCVRVFDSNDPVDCDGCGYAPLSPEAVERQRPLRERLDAALARQLEAFVQMRQRSGPVYELARERSRIIIHAYRAVGRPRKVSRMIVSGEPRYVFWVRRGGDTHPEPAGKADADAWYAWWRERQRLRWELGMRRGPVRLA